MIKKNNPIYHFINLITYWIYSITRNNNSLKNDPSPSRPIWVTGLFRSGTSLTTNLLSVLGIDLGPDNHLLKAVGKRKMLNPSGFFENYLFMDWSLKVFIDLDSWGHIPPSTEKVMEYSEKVDPNDFAYHSIVTIHDDRISNINKLKVLRRYSPANFNDYLYTCFEAQFAIKNPHFSVLYPILLKQWPQSTFLVVFRNPDETIRSAKKVAPSTDYNLYLEYYKRLLKEEDVPAVYFSYDDLISNPTESIKALANVFKLDENKINEAVSLVNTKGSGHQKDETSAWPDELKTVYQEMKKRAINC